MANYKGLTLIFSFFIFCFCLENCTSDKETFGFNTKYIIDTISIEIDSTYLESYYVFSYNALEKVYVGYNGKRHTLDFLSLQENKTLGHLSLFREGPNAIAEVSGIDFINKDSIWISDNEQLKLLDDKGIVKQSFKLNAVNNDSISGLDAVCVNQYFRLRYNRSRGSVFFYNLFGNKPYDENALVSEFFLREQKIKPVNIKFEDIEFDNNEQLGFFAYLNSTFANDSCIIYNYLYSPTIYSYNLNNGQKSIVTVRKNLEKISLLKSIAGQDLQKWQAHSIENPHYFQVLCDNNRHVYYAFNWEGVKYQLNDTEFNSFMDKNISIDIFDTEFKKIGGIKLPKHTYMPFSWFVSNSGLMISNTHPLNKKNSESTFLLHVIQPQI